MGKVMVMVLAAGFSSRMKRNKLLLPFRGKTVIENTVTGFLNSQIDGVMVILGNEKKEIRQALASYPVQFIENHRYDQGMSTSVQAGIRSMSGDSDIDGVMVIPGDMPLVQSKTVNLLLDTYKDSHFSIFIPVYQGKKGHPVLFDRLLFPQLLDISGDVGAREVVQKNISRCLVINTDDPGILIDIDCPEEYQYWNQVMQQDVNRDNY